ncbi:MAG: VWA domain-containing protein [Magnetococcales bacterium]|nr:VWA domain-containing protein [Magnetococcales bacterium]
MFELELQWDRPARVAGGGEEEHVLRLRLRPRADCDTPRLPLHLALALDTSGSMAGEKLVRAREACLALLELLRPGDRFSLATFADTVQPLFQGLTRESAALERARVAIGGIEAAGVTRTDLALAWLSTVLPEEAGRTSRGVLLTDGWVTDPQGHLLADTRTLEQQAHALSRRGITLDALGLGNAEEFNTPFLLSLCDPGLGRFLFAPRPGDLRSQLVGRLGIAQSMAAQSVQLFCTPARPGVQVAGCCRFRPDYAVLQLPVQFGAPISLGTLRADTPTDILLSVMTPPLGMGGVVGAHDLLEVAVVVGEQRAQAMVSLRWTLSYIEAQAANQDVVQDRTLWEINLHATDVQKCTDPNRTGELLERIAAKAGRMGRPDLADVATQQWVDLKKTGRLDRNKSTGLLVATRHTEGP